MIPIPYPYVTHMILCHFCKNHAYIVYILCIYTVFVVFCMYKKKDARRRLNLYNKQQVRYLSAVSVGSAEAAFFVICISTKKEQSKPTPMPKPMIRKKKRSSELTPASQLMAAPRPRPSKTQAPRSVPRSTPPTFSFFAFFGSSMRSLAVSGSV